MRSFKDSEGRSWDINLNIATLKRVKNADIDHGRGVDLLNLDTAEKNESPLVTRLAMDIALLCDVIYVCIQPQAVKREINDEQFGEALGGEVIVKARTAFFEELADFFQSVGRKELVRAIKMQEILIASVIEKADQKLDGMNLDKMVDDVVQKTFGGQFTNTLES